MNELHREIAPLSDDAWKTLDTEARRVLAARLAARHLVDFRGPLGWQASSVELGRVVRLPSSGAPGVEARVRRVLPFVELEARFRISRDEVRDLERGAQDADLPPLQEAAQRIADAEDALVFHGLEAAGVTGLAAGSTHEPIVLPASFDDVAEAIAQATSVLDEAGVDGPYGLALDPASYTALFQARRGGVPVVDHVRRLIAGPIVRAPALGGVLVVSLRGGDHELSVGRDLSLAYCDHDAKGVELALLESVTFRLLARDAAVALKVPSARP